MKIRNIILLNVLCWGLCCSLFGQETNRLTNPILSMRDGAVERFMGYFYAIGEGTAGKIYTSQNLIKWSGPTLAVTTDKATWLNDPQWTEASVYTGIMAGDLVYRNGVFHTYWNGIGHAYASTPLEQYKESSITEPFDDYGIDVQVFQDENGDLYYVKKRNPADPHPITGAASTIDGAEVWIYKMNTPFSIKDATTRKVQLTHQRGHPTSVNHVNFEGPELLKYRGKYYILYASNRMGPRSGMYQVGAASSDSPMTFENSKKYPNPILTRNTEQQLLDYKALLNSAEHGGWSAKYTTGTPSGAWKTLSYDDSSWSNGVGGFGRQEYDYYSGTVFTNAKVRARKTAWTTSKIYIRRKLTLDKVPESIALKYWVNADANFYINGNLLNIKAVNETYCNMDIDPAMFVVGENIIAIEATSQCSGSTCQQLIDFGLFDTGGKSVENVIIGPSQPNFVTGPNGFERWMMYKGYFNGNQIQGIDRIHFYDKELVAETSTVKNSSGYRPTPSLPTNINLCTSAIYYPFETKRGEWRIAGGVLSQNNTQGGEIIYRKSPESNYRFEAPFRILDPSGWAGVYAFYQDEDNWLKVEIGRNRQWRVTKNIAGVTSVKVEALPTQFAFLENNSLVTSYEEPWHTLTIYKNGGKFKVELDYFNLTLDELIDTPFSGLGTFGLTASSDNITFDAMQYTIGYDEYDDNIAGWENLKGQWIVDSKGLNQLNTTGEAQTFKGDSLWNYEFSTYVKTETLPTNGKIGFYPIYINENNNVKVAVNYSTKTLDLEGKKDGVDIQKQSVPLTKRILKYYTVSQYPTTQYKYDLRNESLISGIEILWFEGEYPYLSQTFDLPKTVTFYAYQNGSWVKIDAQLEGELRFSEFNKFTFAPIKASAIMMVVTNNTGKASRAFSAYFTEESSAGYFLRGRRESDGLHIFLDDDYKLRISDDWGKARVGLFTEDVKATFNGMLSYQSGGVSVGSIGLDESVSCKVGESVQLLPQIQPYNATNTTLYWVSSNSDVVSVDNTGRITRHKSGDVTITAYSTDGTFKTATTTVDESGSGVVEIQNDFDFKIYPNPARDILHYSSERKPENIKVYSTTGRKVIEMKPRDSNEIRVDFLSAGVYLVEFQIENKDVKTRFIKN